MGSSVMAICPCGVEAEIMIGGGMMNHETCCLFPCCCDNCNSLIETNVLKKLRCPNCRSVKLFPYTDPRLMGEKGEYEVVQWGDRTLTNGTYKCPKCEQMTLRFSPGCINWD